MSGVIDHDVATVALLHRSEGVTFPVAAMFPGGSRPAPEQSVPAGEHAQCGPQSRSLARFEVRELVQHVDNHAVADAHRAGDRELRRVAGPE